MESILHSTEPGQPTAAAAAEQPPVTSAAAPIVASDLLTVAARVLPLMEVTDATELHNRIGELILELHAAQSQADGDEGTIIAKMELGLTREQAISVIKRQRAFDADKPARDQRHAAVTASARQSRDILTNGAALLFSQQQARK